MMKFLFGGGWWTLWYAVMWLGSAMFIVLPVFALIRDAVPKPAGPASLGSVMMTLSAVTFLGGLTLVNAAIAARLGGGHWVVVALIAIAACAAATMASYGALFMVCEKGGYRWCTVSAVVCGVFLVANLAALSIARGVAARAEGGAVMTAE